ncbi:MAG: RNA polymerase sigma factor SigR [Haliangiales bacterium]
MLNRRKRRSEFERIALPYLDALYGAAYRMTRHPRDAEDLVQDTMLRAYRFWDGFQKDSNCKAWLFRILTNTFINSYQKKKRSREILDAAQAEQRATDGVLYQERSLDQLDPEGLLAAQTLSDDIVRALEALPADFRAAVVLCDVQGFSYKEIADIMDCPVGTVMSRLHRGRRLLKKALHGFAVEHGIIRVEEPASDTPTGAGDSHRRADNQIPEASADAPTSNTIDLSEYRQRKG